MLYIQNRSRIHEQIIPLRILGIILRVLKCPYAMFTLQTSYKPFFAQGGGGGGKLLRLQAWRVKCKIKLKRVFRGLYVISA
jgi:hypothetical protein